MGEAKTEHRCQIVWDDENGWRDCPNMATRKMLFGWTCDEHIAKIREDES